MLTSGFMTSHGSGLGLSIVAAIAKAHGAIISARPGNEGGLDIEIIFATQPPGMTFPAGPVSLP